MAVIAIGSFYLGTTQAETITAIKEVEKVVAVVPDGYIKLDGCIPLDDIAYCFIDCYDYPCFSLKDVGHQLDDINNRSYADIMNSFCYIKYLEMSLDLQHCRLKQCLFYAKKIKIGSVIT